MNTTVLSFHNISVDIVRAPVLRSISADFGAGEILGVVGRNGAGKTTLLRTIMGLLPIKDGQVLFKGSDLASFPAHQRARLGIGYAPQERVMFPTFTIEENLRLPCQVARMSKREIDDRLAMTLEVVPQLRDMLPRSGAALSGGQGKMAALGRALMIGHEMVLLDEPFQGLAPALATEYSNALRRLQQLLPDLCIVVTESNGSLLKDVPDRILQIERGALTNTENRCSSEQPLPQGTSALSATGYR